MPAQLTIGEFSIMTQLSKKALRHYHEAGLLLPAWIDPSTGYRFYDTSQVSTAHVIRRFRELDMPVPDVKAALAATTVERRNEIVAAHLRRMEEQLEQVRETVGALRQLIESPELPITVAIRSSPAIHAWVITETVHMHDIGEWWSGAVREIRSELHRTGSHATGPFGGLYAPELFTDEQGEATIFFPVADPRTSPATSPATGSSVAPTGRVTATEIPAAELAVTVHVGSHATADRTYGALGSYVAERRLGAEGPLREIYLADENGPSLTEICWPVRP